MLAALRRYVVRPHAAKPLVRELRIVRQPGGLIECLVAGLVIQPGLL